MLLIALAAAAAPVVGCDARITGAFREYPSGRRVADRFEIDRRRDRVFGPLAFSGLRVYLKDWDRMVEQDQWIKSIAVMRPGRRVTVVVPRSQRSWMKLTWGNGYAATFKSCRRGEGESGASGNTAWSGGFEFDYAKAPKQGRCAKIRLRYDGRTRTRRLLGPNVPGC